MIRRLQYQAQAFVQLVQQAAGLSPAPEFQQQSLPINHWHRAKHYSLAAVVATTVFVPVVQAAPTPIPTFSQNNVTISVPVRFQYQSHFREIFQPAAVEEVTIDKWQQPISQPQFKRHTRYTYQSFFTNQTLHVPSEDSFVYPTQIPVPPKPQTRNDTLSFVEIRPSENVSADRWIHTNQLPTRKVARYQHQSFFFEPNPIPEAEIVTVDKWFTLTSQPISKLRQRQGAGGVVEYVPTPVENVTLDKWNTQYSNPVRRKTPLNQGTFSFVTIIPSENTSVDRWFQPASQPVRAKQRWPQSSITEPFTDIAAVTYLPYFGTSHNTIVTQRQVQYQANFNPLRALVVAEDVTVDKWFQPLSQPVARTKRVPRETYVSPIQPIVPMALVNYQNPVTRETTVYLRDGFFFVPNYVVAEDVTLDKWSQSFVFRHVRPNRLHISGYTAPVYPFHFIGLGYIVGLNNNTNTGIGKRGKTDLGLNRNTNTGIGKRGGVKVGLNKNTNTGIGRKLT